MTSNTATREGESLSGRNARRKSRTRAALIGAAQQLLVLGDVDVSIQAITDRADVGIGSFYNHFESKGELFASAMADAFQEYHEWRDERLGDNRDPIRGMAMSIRLTGRLAASKPDLARILTTRARSLSGSEGLAPRVGDDIAAALRASPFAADQPDVTAIAAAGAVAAVLRVAVERAPAEQARMADAVARVVLRMFGTDEATIAELLAEPLPLSED